MQVGGEEKVVGVNGEDEVKGAGEGREVPEI